MWQWIMAVIVGLGGGALGATATLLWQNRRPAPPPQLPPTPEQRANREAAEAYARSRPVVRSTQFVRPNRASRLREDDDWFDGPRGK